jgi:hypothetical protein
MMQNRCKQTQIWLEIMVNIKFEEEDRYEIEERSEEILRWNR